jgi:Bifunctional DNA primase/polymerase, N-terminal
MTYLPDALRYAARGWMVFPIRPRTKLPATPRGFYDATTNPAKLQRWFAHYDHNIGIRTGIASGICVIDIDGAAGAATLRDLGNRHGCLPPTLTAITPNGRHLWFRLDEPLPSSNSRIGNHIDVKADGGFIICPPSQHPSGDFYRWYDQTIDLAPAPDWLIRLAQKRRLESPRPDIPVRSGPPGSYGRAALEREIKSLAATLPGTRNTALNRSAFRLFQLVGGGELDQGQVERALCEACIANNLVADDGWPSVRATIQSGARAGMQHPRGRRTT